MFLSESITPSCHSIQNVEKWYLVRQNNRIFHYFCNKEQIIIQYCYSYIPKTYILDFLVGV